MRNPGEVAESQNLTRPRVGVFIGLNSNNNNANNTINNNSNNSNNVNNRISIRFESNKLLITKQPNLEISSLPKFIQRKSFFDSYSQTAENSSIKKPQIIIFKNDEFSYLNSVKIKQVETSKEKEEEKSTENKNGIFKFYSTGSKKIKTEKNEIAKDEENKLKEIETKEKKDKITNDLGNTKTKFSLLKKLSEKNLINLKAESTNNFRESKIEFRDYKSITKPFSTNQLKLNNDNSKTPVIVKENIKPILNSNSKLLNFSDNKSLEKNAYLSKDNNKFRRTSNKK